MGSGPGNQARASYGLAEAASGYGDPAVGTELRKLEPCRPWQSLQSTAHRAISDVRLKDNGRAPWASSATQLAG